MISRMILSAMFKTKNILFLVCWFIGISLMKNIQLSFLPTSLGIGLNQILMILGVLIYGGIVAKILYSKDFHEEFERLEKVREIRELNQKCVTKAHESKKYLDYNFRQKLKKVFREKDEILQSFFKSEKQFMKEKIALQAVKLTNAYIDLMVNYARRSSNHSIKPATEIIERLADNKRKLSFTKDPINEENLRKTIEMDEKIVERTKDEKNQLIYISGKLDYIESTLSVLKHNMLASIDSEDIFADIDDVVTETTVLDNVLEERRRERHRV